MIKKKNVLIFAFFIFLGVLSFYFDKELIGFVSKIQFVGFQNFFLSFALIYTEIIVLFVLTSLFLWNEKKRRWILPLWFTLFATAVVSFLIKFSVQRLRPYQADLIEALPILIEKSHLVWNYSFPSFQSALGFCALPILSKEFPRFKYFWILIAFIIAFSRFYFGVHFMSDVIVGGILGYAIGLIVLKLEEDKRIFERIKNKLFR